MGIPEAIAIVGRGCRFPGNADSPSSLWDLLVNPTDLSSFIPKDRFHTRGYYHQDGQYHGHTNVEKSYLLADEGSVRRFDAQFFGITPLEANSLDPQVRLLLETVFEALEDGGQPIENLRGSQTAVYSGMMVSDYEHMMCRDQDSISTHHITGTARSLMSNRISYFFDWHGPSMTIDTACSSSLYAVHHAVQHLRSGASQIAIATGSNLLLDPVGYIGESKLQMLSPTGRSRMWDIGADGYARGEGVAAVVLKTVAQAEKDGDYIHCIIRETAVNQDGRTKSMTVPSARAQSDLIKTCYQRAGLDIHNSSDLPQYFEAHGTGTPTGDPIEAEAISSIFANGASHGKTLHVGSIKTVMGHSEGTAGLAGIFKVSLALQKAVIPPNLLFQELNPAVRPYYRDLKIPTAATPWPTVPEGAPRRASVNSFGFGGANAHAILETYQTPAERRVYTPDTKTFSPYMFSATSESSLINNLRAVSDYLKREGSCIDMYALAHTLHSRRTRLPIVVSFSASTSHELCSKLDEWLDTFRDRQTSASLRRITTKKVPSSKVICVFTGQGAQWVQMGAELLAKSASCRSLLEKLDARLSCLPEPPSWSLVQELERDEHSSRVHQAALTQPLCTAVQILLVDIMQSAHVPISAVVGHSSGEIAAAYAQAVISAEDAICIAYYRGLHTRLNDAGLGAMLAVGSSQSDIQELLNEPEFVGRACIAAINSANSVTVSGDVDAIHEIQAILKDERKFARILKVDQAYHSHLMATCSAAYLQSLDQIKLTVPTAVPATWSSSTYGGSFDGPISSLSGAYWNQNLQSPVQFMQAVGHAWNTNGPFDMAIEIGPHSALKAPFLQNINELCGHDIPYTSLLRRGSSDLASVAEGLGYIAATLGKESVDFCGFDTFMSGVHIPPLHLELPRYSWNHENEYWFAPRQTRAILQRSDSNHMLLGHLCPNSTNETMSWRNILRPKEIRWLEGHRIQGQIVFPAAGYIVAAVEAALKTADLGSISLVQVSNVVFNRALIFGSSESDLEVVTYLTDIQKLGKDHVKANYSFNAAMNHSVKLEALSSGCVDIWMDESPSTLPIRSRQPTNLIEVQSSEFYEALSSLGYHYAGPFVALEDIHRKHGAATGSISNKPQTEFLIHPATIDAAFQSVLLAASAPGDGRLRSIHLPVSISRLTFDVRLCLRAQRRETHKFDAFQSGRRSISGHVDIVDVNRDGVFVQIEDLRCHPLTSPTQIEDRNVFSRSTWGPLLPIITQCEPMNDVLRAQSRVAHQLERLSWFYLRLLDKQVPIDHSCRNQGPYVALFDFITEARSNHATRGKPWWNADWENDNLRDVILLPDVESGCADYQLLHTLGENIVPIVTGHRTAIEVAMQGDVLAQYYQHGVWMSEYTAYLAQVIAQIAFRFPHLQCLEIGAGTGGATRTILQEVKQSFTSYTFTDISSGFFSAAETLFADDPTHIIYKVLDINSDPARQDFVDHSYDVVIASLVLHTTISLRQTLRHIRQLLKPGGYLVALELGSDLPVRWTAMFGCFPGWWIGADDGRRLSPCVDVKEWHDLLLECGFSGCDTATPQTDSFNQPLTVFVSQALDERVSFLRDPLSSLDKMHSLNLCKEPTELIILGGAKNGISDLVNQLDTRSRTKWTSVRVARTLEDFYQIQLLPTSMVLSVLELERPIFCEMKAMQWEQLKGLFQGPRSIMWVTSGRRAAEPYANMLPGAVRIVTHETLGLNVQFLDIEAEDELSSSLLETSMLRFRASLAWQRESIDVAFAQMERELVIVSGGQVLVQRLIPDKPMNDRLNSCHRTIERIADVGEVGFSLSSKRDAYVVEENPDHGTRRNNSSVVRRIMHSLLSPIVMAGQSLFLSLGVEHADTTSQFLALSCSRTSCLTEEQSLMHPVKVAPGREAEYLTLVSQINLIHNNLRGLQEGDHLLVLEPPIVLIYLLKKIARKQDLRVTYVTARTEGLPGCLVLHPCAPNWELDTLDLASVTMLLDLSDNEGHCKMLRVRLQSAVSHWCRHVSFPADCSVAQSRSCKLELTSIPRLRRELLQMVEEMSEVALGCSRNQTSIPEISLEKLSHAKLHDVDLKSIVHWPENGKIAIRINPIDSFDMFSPDKTYWLVGLTGSLGISLCEWMTQHGARHLVLSSRSPRVDAHWLEDMARAGATVWIRSCDVSIKSELVDLFDEIRANLPPIAGVAQGAMILKDANMGDTDYESFTQVTLPKVQGSVYLNELFQDRSLDFFVFFSSISSFIGLPGQSAYAAANMFMTALAEQRRQRGLAASVINIGAIIGAGYITRMGQDISTSRNAFGFTNLSVSDFHQLFAEAVVNSSAEVSSGLTAGLAPIGWNEPLQPRWTSNTLMTHLISNVSESTKRSMKAAPELTLHCRLLEAESLDQIRIIVHESLCKFLGDLLRLTPSMMISLKARTSLEELGIDSILALEIRAWLMENLRFNLSVLKILRGITIEDLVSASVSGMDVDLVPQLGNHSSHVSSMIVPPLVGGLSSHQASLDEKDLSSSAINVCPNSVTSPPSAVSASTDKHKPEAVRLTTMELSASQKMFWSALALFEDKTNLTFSAVCSVDGPLDTGRLDEALQNLGQQHDVLRTSFVNDNGVPMQVIMRSSTLRLEHEWADDESSVVTVVDHIRGYKFSPECGDLVKFRLISITSQRHFIVLAVSHLCMDGISVRILLDDLFRHYHRQPPSYPAIQFRQYAEVRRVEIESGQLEYQFDYWKSQYPDFPPLLPILRVSRATLRPTLESFRSTTIKSQIDLQTKHLVTSVCRRCGVTPFHFYLTVFRILLSRLSDIDDIAIGIVDSGRNDDNIGSLGVYANVLPLRFRGNPIDLFEVVLQDTRTVALNALQNSSIPFQTLINRLLPPRTASATPLFQCLINYRPDQRKTGGLEELKIDLISLEISNTGYDLSLDVVDDQDQDCLLALSVNNDIYSRDEAAIVLDMYKRLVSDFSVSPHVATTEPNIYDQGGVANALGFGMGLSQDRSRKKTIEQRVQDIAIVSPNAIAIRSLHEDNMTYAELVNLKNEIAARLIKFGLSPGTLIATLQEHTATWVASVLAIMQVGSIYLPLDPSMRMDRLHGILNKSKPQWLLVDNQSLELFTIMEYPDINMINVSVRFVGQHTQLETRVFEESAMVLYTSGSTGDPKGIVLRHESIMNLIESIKDVYDIDETTCALQQSAATFDMCYAQLFMPLGHGGSVVLLPQYLRGDSFAITEVIARQSVTFTNATPTEYSSWLRYGNAELLRASQWQVAVSGGEHVRMSLLQQFQELGLSALRVFNSYGPTEITWGVTSGNLIHGDRIVQKCGISAGTVLPNYSVYLVDESLRPVPPGISGEIYVGGSGVAAGYLEDPTLSSESFMKDTFAPSHLSDNGWKTMYRTGDIGRWNLDGTLVIEGRINRDTQVKLRGFRFDLQDVELAMIDHAAGAISEAVVSVRSLSLNSSDFLVAHIKIEQTLSVEGREELLSSLSSSLPLPHYMLPSAIFELDKFPRTTSSKLDRRAVAALPLPESHWDSQSEDIGLTNTQLRLRDVWLSIIPVSPQKPILSTTDFFHIGGTSLLLVQLQSELKKHPGVDIPLSTLLKASILASMALLLEGRWEPEPIDWDQETMLGDNINLHVDEASGVDPTFENIVVLTGATGFLGNAIRDALLSEESVSEVHCIGVRNIDKDLSALKHPKVFFYEGDITHPFFGLSVASRSRIFDRASCVINAAADISHRQAYHSLRAANLESLKELVMMSLSRRIPLHHVSTSQVGILYSAHTGQDEFPEVSVAQCIPATDGTDGYTSSKWAAERFLERLSDEFDSAWPIYVHRPSLILRPESPADSIVHSIAKFSSLIGARPALDNYRGYLNTVDLDKAIRGIMSAVRESRLTDGALSVLPTGLHFRHYINEGEPARFDDLRISELPSALGGNSAASTQDPANETFESLTVHEWAARASSLGLAPKIVHWVENAGLSGIRVFPRLIAQSATKA